MPWVLLGILLLFSQLFLWANFFSYRNLESTGGRVFLGGAPIGGRLTGDAPVAVTCNDLLAGRTEGLPAGIDPRLIEGLQQQCQQAMTRQQERLEGRRNSFTLPESLSGALTAAQGIGVILMAILTASVIGTDFGWGTVRLVLVRGIGRWQYLAGKLAVLALVSVGALVVVTAATVVSSLIAGALVGGGASDWAVLSAFTDWARGLGRVWFSFLPYVVLAALFTVLTRSSAGGMAIALAYSFGEQIVVLILINLFDWFQNVADFLLGRNIAGWMLGEQREGLRGMILGGGVGLGEFPDGLHAFLVLGAYILVLGGLAFWLFQKRDVQGASGG